MLFVGRFTEADLNAKKDKEAIKEAKELNPDYKYIYAKEVKKSRKIVALDVWLITPEMYYNSGII